VTALVQRRSNNALTTQQSRSTKPFGQQVKVTETVEQRQDCRLRPNRRSKSVHRAREIIGFAAYQHQIIRRLDLFADDGASVKFLCVASRNANGKPILSDLFGASGTYQEGYVTSCLQQSATKITADSARTNDKYSHLTSPLHACCDRLMARPFGLIRLSNSRSEVASESKIKNGK
jgi:hypothetical protein